MHDVQIAMRSTWIWDICHRLVNDKSLAIAECGLAVLNCELRQVLRLEQGPFKNGGSHHWTIVKSLEDFFQNNTHHSLIWQYSYDDWCDERCSDHPERGEERHIQSEFHRAASMVSHAKPEDHRDFRWWSFETKSRRCQVNLVLKRIGISWVGVRRNWWPVGRCPLLTLHGTCDDDDGDEPLDVPLIGEEPEAAEEGAAAGSREGGGDGDADEGGGAVTEGNDDDPNNPVTKRVSTAEAREIASKRRSKVASTLKYVIGLICSDITLRLWKVSSHLPLAVETFFREELIPGIKTRKGVQYIHEQFAQSMLLDLAATAIDDWASDDFAHILGMQPAGSKPHDGLLEQDTLVARTAWIYALTFAAEISLTSFWYQTPSVVYIALTDPNPAVVESTLKMLEKLWTALQNVQEVATYDRDAAAFVKNLCWPLAQWTMEIYTCLLCNEFKGVPKDAATEILYYARSFLSSLVTEGLHNMGRSKAALNRKQAFGLEAYWHAGMRESDTLTEHGRPPVVVTAAAKSAAAAGVPASVFDYVDNNSSVPIDDLARLTSPSPEWPTADAAGVKKIGMATQLLLDKDGDWEKMKNGWQNLLLLPGTVCRKSKGKGILVLRSLVVFS